MQLLRNHLVGVLVEGVESDVRHRLQVLEDILNILFVRCDRKAVFQLRAVGHLKLDVQLPRHVFEDVAKWGQVELEFIVTPSRYHMLILEVHNLAVARFAVVDGMVSRFQLVIE